jgi:two-component system sensor histidine kinase DesK
MDDPTMRHKGTWWRLFFSGIWLVYLAYPVSQLFGHHHSAPYTAGGVAIVAAFCVIYVFLLYRWDLPGERPYAGLAAMVILAAVASIVYGGAGALWIYVSSTAGLVIRRDRLAFRTVLAITVAFSVFSLVAHTGWSNYLVNLVPTVLVGLSMIGFRRQIELNRELSQARETVAKLAASEERLRLARDMHDLTGQSLSMITLKSELAAKRLTRMPANGSSTRTWPPRRSPTASTRSPRASVTCSRRRRTAGRSPRSPPSCTCPRGRCAITCPRASRKPGPGTAPMHCESPPNEAGCKPLDAGCEPIG